LTFITRCHIIQRLYYEIRGQNKYTTIQGDIQLWQIHLQL